MCMTMVNEIDPSHWTQTAKRSVLCRMVWVSLFSCTLHNAPAGRLGAGTYTPTHTDMDTHTHERTRTNLSQQPLCSIRKQIKQPWVSFRKSTSGPEGCFLGLHFYSSVRGEERKGFTFNSVSAYSCLSLKFRWLPSGWFWARCWGRTKLEQLKPSLAD